MSSKILGIEETAERLRISKHTLYNWLKNSKSIRKYAFKIGEKKWAFKEEDIEKFINEQKRKSRREIKGNKEVGSSKHVICNDP